MIELRFHLILHEHGDGRVTASFAAFPNLRAHASAPAVAIESARAQLSEYLAGPITRALDEYVFCDSQTVRVLPIELVPANNPSSYPIRVSVLLLLTPREYGGGRGYLITAPRVNGFQVLISDDKKEDQAPTSDVSEDDRIDKKIATALARFTKTWGAEAILKIDQVGAVTMETITAAIPDPSPAVLAEKTANTAGPPNVLQVCGVKLSAGSSNAQPNRAYGRESLVEQLIASLATGPRHSVILVGRSGVGKTALVDELVARIHNGNVPAELKGREVWSVTANNLIAGMKFTGEWQGRIQALINLVRKGRQILFMDDPGQIADVGRWSQSDNNMSRFLRPYLESGDVVIICEATEEVYAATRRQEPGFLEALTRIDVPETDEASTVEILHAVARHIAEREEVAVDPTAVAAVLDLTRRFRPDQAFPGKAIRLLEESVIAAQREGKPDSGPTTVGRSRVISHFSASTGTSEVLLSDEHVLPPAEIRAYFTARLFGQAEAIEAMVDLISTIKAGLNDPSKPLGSFVFLGPTGVGKTEIAKILAEFLFGNRDRLLRFDMSEYQELYSVSRLIGAPPGYVGHQEAGQLTEAVRQRPFSVVLFDEIEKAHRGIHDALLSVLGEGRLTDGAGRTADFHNAIVIMTSNLGASRRDQEPLGFGRVNAHPADEASAAQAYFVAEAERFFRPEFFNRIDRIVAFRPLGQETIRLIIRRELQKLLRRDGIVRRGLQIEVDEALVEHIAEVGFHPLYGARPLQRTIERLIIAPLARLVVSEKPQPNQTLYLGVRDGRVHVSPLADPEGRQEALPLGDADELEPSLPWGRSPRGGSRLRESVSTRNERSDDLSDATPAR